MGYHPIESLMKVTMDSLKDMVDVNTVVGEPVETKDGTVIIPVSRVSFGFVAGGGEDSMIGDMMPSGGSSKGESSRDNKGSGDENGQYAGDTGDMPFTGGTGAGVSVRPVGFLVVGERNVKFLPVDSRALVDRLIEEAPGMFSRIAGAFGCRRDHDDSRDDHEDHREREEGHEDEDREERRRPRSRDRRDETEG